MHFKSENESKENILWLKMSKLCFYKKADEINLKELEKKKDGSVQKPKKEQCNFEKLIMKSALCAKSNVYYPKI